MPPHRPAIAGSIDTRAKVLDICRELLGHRRESGASRTGVVICDVDSLQVAGDIARTDVDLSLLVFTKGTSQARPEDVAILPENCRVGTGQTYQERVMEVAKLATAPCLVIEYDGRPERVQASAFPVFFGVLADGGHYVLLDNDRPVKDVIPGVKRATARQRIQWYVDHADSITEAQGRWAPELSRSVASLRIEGELSIVQKDGDHLFKLHHDEMEDVGRARWGEQWAETLVRHAPYEYTMPGRLILANEGPITADRRRIQVPERVLRRHLDVTMSRRMLLRRDNLVLSESFHHPSQLNLGHPRLWPISRAMARTMSTRPARDLDGNYFMLDTNYPGHFGHITTEVLGMMWGWLELQRRGVAARPIVSTYVDVPMVPKFQLDIFAAFGIDEADIEVVAGHDVVRVPELYTATQQIESPKWIDRDIVATWRVLWSHLRERAASLGETGLEADRIFVSRRPGPKRNCTNTAEVEDYFRSRGFAIYFPEDHPYLHQVMTFARASRIAGFGGSGMFNMMFAPHAKVLIITSDGYAATNEMLLSAANGNDITYLWGSAETRPIRMGRHDPASFRADFAVDLHAHRRQLRRFTSRWR